MQRRLFVSIHKAWLKLLFSSFAVSDREWAEKLYDYSEIIYNHLRFIKTIYALKNIEYSYERPAVELNFKTEGEVAKFCDKALECIQDQIDDSGSDPLAKRVLSDLDFIRSTLKCEFKRNKKVTAFDKSLMLDEIVLEKSSLDTLIMFLFEESYKEYELIIVYSYAETIVEDKRLSEIFQILIDESKFHLKSFARMMAKMGILAVPRMVTQEIYKFKSLKRFLEDSIEEEKSAKEQCKALAKAIDNEGLQSFFDFINSQEDYHITLLQEALERLE